MSKCKRCNEEIEFKPHPISGKLTPFSNGEIHFAGCKAEKNSFTTETSIPEMRCFICGAPPKYVYWGEISTGKRLRLGFKCYHKGIFLAHVPNNINAVNCTEEQYLKSAIAEGLDKWGNFRRRLMEITKNTKPTTFL